LDFKHELDLTTEYNSLNEEDLFVKYDLLLLPWLQPDELDLTLEAGSWNEWDLWNELDSF